MSLSIDKQAHAAACAALFAAIYVAVLPLGRGVSAIVALAVVVILSWYKEAVYDTGHAGHSKDWWDARAGLGGALVMAVWLMLAVPALHYPLRLIAR